MGEAHRTVLHPAPCTQQPSREGHKMCQLYTLQHERSLLVCDREACVFQGLADPVSSKCHIPAPSQKVMES